MPEPRTCFAVVDPRTGATVTEVPEMGAAETLAAVDIADAAQREWAARSPRDRADLLHRVAGGLDAGREQLAELIHRETGKPRAEADAETTYARDYVVWFAEEAGRIGGRYTHGTHGGRLLSTKAPVGPCLLITPWNFPLAMVARKLSPALAAGCTAIVKPAEQAPLSTLLFAEMIVEAGVPEGVVQVITTAHPERVSEAALADPRIRKLSFTGSTAVGRSLLRLAAHRVLRVSMELGGDAPFLVFADAHIGDAVENALVAKLRNAGQACTAANRFLVEQSVATTFTRRLAEAMRDCEIGPLIDAGAREKVDRLVRDAIERGGTCHVGGRARSGPGFFYEPTVLTDVPEDAEIHHSEVFGPVAVVQAFATEHEAISLANRSEHGLAAYVQRGDVGAAVAIAEALDAAMVAINRGTLSDAGAPFGGVKSSGLGREGGRDGIYEYLESRFYAVDWPSRSGAISPSSSASSRVLAASDTAPAAPTLPPQPGPDGAVVVDPLNA